MGRRLNIPYLFKLAQQIHSIEVALERILYKNCLFCGALLTEPKEFCNRACQRAFFKWKQKFYIKPGTIKIRPKKKDESWEEYHEYLKSLKIW